MSDIKKNILIIPLGGMGERFKRNGYRYPKPMIKVMGKMIIEWLLDSINYHHIEKVLIGYHKELSKYRFEEKIRGKYRGDNYPVFDFYCCEEMTSGAVETIYETLIHCMREEDEDKGLLCLDGDNFYLCDIFEKWNGENSVFVFEDEAQSLDNTENAIYSYSKIDEDGKIIEIAEKNKISNYANTGGYGFKSYREFLFYSKMMIENGIKERGEYYTSRLIKEMIYEEDMEFNIKEVRKDDFICLGTPIQVRLFCNNYPVISAKHGNKMIKTNRYVFQFEHVLYDIMRGRLNEKNIQYVKYLKRMNQYIHLKTFMSKDEIDMILNENEIPYDSIDYNEFEYDMYISHHVINENEVDIEKELGYYNMKIEPRKFHKIMECERNTVQCMRKEGKDLSGEIEYYLMLPDIVKDLFPIMFCYDEEMKWYEMEKINGIPFSNLYLSEEMTECQFEYILGSLHRLHEICFEERDEDKINIYENYVNKMRIRYDENMDFYNQYERFEEKYNHILYQLEKYEIEEKGKIGMIHGDPVFTNIMLNGYGKIKMIDMRGKMGDKNTIYGDIFYDYAKIYQSITGYEEILGGKRVSNEYRDRIKNVFHRIVTNKYGEEYMEYIKVITCSLYMSLLPLHRNDKCIEYYECINQFMNE